MSISINSYLITAGEKAMEGIAAWASDEAALMAAMVRPGERNADAGRRRIMEHASCLFGSALLAPDSARLLWAAFAKGVRLAFGEAKAVTDAIRHTVISCRGEGIDVLPIRWEDMFFLDTDLRSALAVMRDDGISPLQATCPDRDPARQYAEAWLRAIDEVSSRIEEMYPDLDLGRIERENLSALIYNAQGWGPLLSPDADHLIRSLSRIEDSPLPHTVLWRSMGDVPMVYGDERKRREEKQEPMDITLDTWSIRCGIEADIYNRARTGRWKDDPVEAGAMRFLTGFRNMLKNSKCTGSDVLKVFYCIYNASRLFDSLIFPEAEYGSEKLTVFNLLQMISSRHPELLAPDAGIFSMNAAAFVRLLMKSGCMPEGPHDAVRHSRLTGWMGMKTEIENRAMRMRCLTPSKTPAPMTALSNPPLMASLGACWDTVFDPRED